MMIFHANLRGKIYQIEIEKQHGKYLVNIDGKSYQIDSRQISKGELSLTIQGKVYDLIINGNSQNHQVQVGPFCYNVELLSSSSLEAALQSISEQRSGKISISTPMPGKVVKVLKELHESVKAGEGVIIVEAMKMENELKSPKEGKISEIRVSQGKAVESGEVLVVIE